MRLHHCAPLVLLACGNAEIIATSAPVGGSDSGAASQHSGNAHDTSAPLDSGTSSGSGATVVPLFDESTELEPEIHFDRGDAIVTRLADRGRDRHAREDEFQSYDHYLPHYWTHRSARMMLVDRVSKGDPTIDISVVTEWQLSVVEFRAWYRGQGTVAEYSGNYGAGFVESGPGTFDEDHVQVSEDGTQYRYTFTLDHAISLDGAVMPLAAGQFMEIESSMFLLGPPVGRANYYGTTFLYAVGTGGMVPWEASGDITDPSSERENSHKLDERAWLGGRTTVHRPYSAEPDNAFMQLATNLSGVNGQPFLRGRRVHHTDMLDGSHDESAENGTFDALRGLAGPLYTAASCDQCHHRNGRAAVAETGEALHAWVVRIGDDRGAPLPEAGGVLQSSATTGAGEGSLTIAEWHEDTDGLRSPVYAWSGEPPPRFSARIAPQLVGMGLLEALPEASILALEDPEDSDGDGISGYAHRVADPVDGQTRLGRFGWKASTTSVRHQAAAALRNDMGVMTSIFPEPDCGSDQTDCGNTDGPELTDAHLDDLTRYVALLGVQPRRDIDDAQVLAGEAAFDDMGCADCHVPTLTTSSFHPYAELRDQTIHPYTDLLLHDMGDGLADSLGDGEATGAEWRTPPLWGIGAGPCVTGGMTGTHGSETCAPHTSYLHDGRARTLDEAIRWHGGEGQRAKTAYEDASADERDAVVRFLESL